MVRHMGGYTAALLFTLALLLSLCMPGSASAADLDTEVYNAFMKFYAPADDAEAQAARATARSAPSTSVFDHDPTLALLHTVRNWDKLAPATREKLSRYIDISEGRNGTREVRSIYQNGCVEVVSESSSATMDSSHFRAVYENSSSSQHYTTSEFVSTVLQYAEDIYTKEITNIGLPAPIADTDGKIRLYFCDLIGETGGIVGRTWTKTLYPTNAASTYIELDNDNANITLFDGVTPEEFAGVVLAHEYFHSIQFGINYAAPSLWIMEAHATWIEEEVYPDVNDYVITYLPEKFENLDISIDDTPYSMLLEYASCILFRHITENELDQSFIVDIWTEIKDTCRPPSSVSWCDGDVTELTPINDLLEAEDTSLAEVYGHFSVANYTKDYVDGVLDEFPDVETTAVNLSSSAVVKNSSLDHLATIIYDVNYSGTEEAVKFTMDGTSNTKWIVTIVKNLNNGQFSTEDITLNSSGDGTLTIENAGVDFDTFAVIVNNAGSSADNQAFSLTLEEGESNYVVRQNTYSAGWNIAGAPMTAASSASTPGDAFGLTGTIFFQLKDGKYITENQDMPRPGLGYWVYFSKDTTVTFRGTPSDSGNVSLSAGWNLVSPPYDDDVTWGADISVSNGSSTYVLGSDDAKTLIEDTIYTYDPSATAYRTGHITASGYTIQAWTGFAIYALQDCTLVFPSPE